MLSVFSSASLYITCGCGDTRTHEVIYTTESPPRSTHPHNLAQGASQPPAGARGAGQLIRAPRRQPRRACEHRVRVAARGRCASPTPRPRARSIRESNIYIYELRVMCDDTEHTRTNTCGLGSRVHRVSRCFVKNAFPSRELSLSGSSRCSSQPPSSRRVGSGKLHSTHAWSSV